MQARAERLKQLKIKNIFLPNVLTCLQLYGL